MSDKPVCCPCLRRVNVRKALEAQRWQVDCYCGWCGPWKDTPEEAIEAWNAVMAAKKAWEAFSKEFFESRSQRLKVALESALIHIDNIDDGTWFQEIREAGKIIEGAIYVDEKALDAKGREVTGEP